MSARDRLGRLLNQVPDDYLAARFGDLGPGEIAGLILGEHQAEMIREVREDSAPQQDACDCLPPHPAHKKLPCGHCDLDVCLACTTCGGREPRHNCEAGEPS